MHSRRELTRCSKDDSSYLFYSGVLKDRLSPSAVPGNPYGLLVSLLDHTASSRSQFAGEITKVSTVENDV